MAAHVREISGFLPHRRRRCDIGALHPRRADPPTVIDQRNNTQYMRYLDSIEQGGGCGGAYLSHSMCSTLLANAANVVIPCLGFRQNAYANFAEASKLMAYRRVAFSPDIALRLPCPVWACIVS